MINRTENIGEINRLNSVTVENRLKVSPVISRVATGEGVPSRLNVSGAIDNRLLLDMIEGWGVFEWGMGPWDSPSDLSRVDRGEGISSRVLAGEGISSRVNTDGFAEDRLNSPGIVISRVERR